MQCSRYRIEEYYCLPTPPPPTCRETALLYDPAVSSLSTRESVAQVISHELAHQWFGDLVTMEWWTE